MMTTNKVDVLAQFQFDGYAFTDLKFSFVENFKFSTEEDMQPLTVGFDVELNFDEGADNVNDGRIKLTCSVRSRRKDADSSSFNIDVVMLGFFSTQSKVPPDVMKKFLKVNGVTAMFPFLRSAIADISRISNVTEPVILPLMKISNLQSIPTDGTVYSNK